MKNINIAFEDKEFEIIELAKEKSKLGWHDWMLYLAKEKIEEKE
jgi:hypothetical protein